MPLPPAPPPEISPLEIDPALRSLLALALAEDIGSGDVTSLACVPETARGGGRIFAKAAGTLCGGTVARQIMELVDGRVAFELLAEDGQALAPGSDIARLEGSLRSILTAERVMLNFLQRLSGVATLTRRHADLLRGAGSAIDLVDTRKTTPLWRRLERHAVRCGGGVNHRFALYDMYLVKNNHADAAGGLARALERVHADNALHAEGPLPVAAEARTLEEVRAVLRAGADLLLLDNMDPQTLRAAAELAAGRIRTEVTGGVGLHNLADYAGLPVDRISVGALTHSAPALDIALHLEAKSTGVRP